MNERYFTIIIFVLLIVLGVMVAVQHEYLLRYAAKKVIVSPDGEPYTFLKEYSQSEQDLFAKISNAPGRNKNRQSSPPPPPPTSDSTPPTTTTTTASSTEIASTSSMLAYIENFSVSRVVEEAGRQQDSSDAHWWVNSGGRMIVEAGVGGTVQGGLLPDDKWRLLYAQTNPIDTDDGYHPQNIFRLVGRDAWQNFAQSSYFYVNRLNLSDSPNRNQSNGFFLFNRYQNGDNLYYVGLRVDGAAVIKKKINGTYYTMAYKRLFGTGSWDRNVNYNYLPLGQWLGLRSEIVNNSDNTVTVRLLTDVGRTGNWTLFTESTDDGRSYGGSPIMAAGSAGIRTDFMDATFDDYSIETK